ncbi:alpha/beta fold hydrolase [Mycobacterium pseudokansasii]|uniref:alpha/beta fold hydrolase n=1 Tax=Mycobacterium pseudokansasii TaxID=2341080 RepID=UPI001FCEEB57|nr:alpha/beta hydrolase [Mycobacterium pseudokansasii]
MPGSSPPACSRGRGPNHCIPRRGSGSGARSPTPRPRRSPARTSPTWCANRGGPVARSSGHPWIGAKQTTVNFPAVTAPVLVIGGERDRVVPPQVAPNTADRYQQGTYVEIAGADHLVFWGLLGVFWGRRLPATIGDIEDWMAKNRVFAHPACHRRSPDSFKF